MQNINMELEIRNEMDFGEELDREEREPFLWEGYRYAPDFDGDGDGDGETTTTPPSTTTTPPPTTTTPPPTTTTPPPTTTTPPPTTTTPPPTTTTPPPPLVCGDQFLLSQETVCQWLRCMVGHAHSSHPCEENPACSQTRSLAEELGIADFSLVSCDGQCLCPINALTEHNKITILYDPCTSCGRNVLQYRTLVHVLLGEKATIRYKRTGSCFCS